MPEPTSSGVAGAAAFKAAGGSAAGGALLSTIVVMLMTPPRTHRELSGRIDQHRGHRDRRRGHCRAVLRAAGVDSVTGLVAMGGLIFGCGLPGWAIVRWVFNFIEKNRDAGVDEVAKEVKEVLR